jgi:hypothetical protein
MSRWHCPECDPDREIPYKTGGVCPCSDEKGRQVELVEIENINESDSLKKVNQKIFMAEMK